MSDHKFEDHTLPILLAGGEGTRLRPITASMPKPLIPVDGTPAICRILDTLAALGFSRAVITVRYRGKDIRDTLGTSYAGIRLSYADETDAPRGTAGGVRDAWDRYAAPTDTDALVISGDAVFTCDLAAFHAFYRESRADAALLCVSVSDPGAFGIVNTDDDGRIMGFSEKPCAAETLSDTVNTGIYCLSRAFLAEIPKNGTPDFGQDVFPAALSDGMSLYAYESPDFWCDIGSFSAYLSCSTAISAGVIRTPDTPRSHPMLPPHISDSSIGRECFIPSTASVRGSILFDDVIVGSGASISGSILCRGVHIGDKAVIEPGCVIGEGCILGDGVHLPRGTQLEPQTHLNTKLHTGHSGMHGFPDAQIQRDAFGGGALSPYLSDIGYALSTHAQPEPETAVAFARALAAYAEKQQCALFLCRAEDAPPVHSLLHLVTEVLSCMSHTVPVFCTDDDVLPLPAARMPALPLPDKQSCTRLLRVVFLRRGSIPSAAVFDASGLYPTRGEERLLDTCFSDALSAHTRPAPIAQTPIPPAWYSVQRLRASDLTASYLARYAKGSLAKSDTTPFSFSCGSSPAERLMARLLRTMGGEECVSAPVHFSIKEPYEDSGDILCPLTLTDLRQIRPHGSAAYPHWVLLSHLITHREANPAFRAFPTPRTPDPNTECQVLSVPVCAPMDLSAEFRYSHAPALSDHATEDVGHLARRYAAMEAEDAVLLARDLALLLAARTTADLHPPFPTPTYRRHGLAVSAADPTHPLSLSANLARLTRGDAKTAFAPAVEGVVHRRADGSVRIVATRDHNFRIIADAYSTEAAEELFRFAKDRLLCTAVSAKKG